MAGEPVSNQASQQQVPQNQVPQQQAQQQQVSQKQAPRRQSIEIASFQHANPIPAATRIGPLLTSSIIPPYNPGTRDCPAELTDQIANLFIHVGQMLAAAQASWDDVAKMTFYVQDPVASRQALNEPWLAHFGDANSRPARHNLAVPANDGPVKISCDFLAWVQD